MPARSERRPPHWPNHCPPRMYWAMSMHSRLGSPRSVTKPPRPLRLNAPAVMSNAPNRPPSRRLSPSRPRTSRPTQPSGRLPVIVCVRSSTSGGRSLVWTARLMTLCGSVTQRPGTLSTADGAHTSQNSTASGSASGRPRRSCASGPKNYRTPLIGRRPRRSSAICSTNGKRWAGPRRTSTKPCGSDSKLRRTSFSPHATRSAPNVTPNSSPTVLPRRNSWPRPRRLISPTSTPPALHCAPSPTNGMRSATRHATAPPIWTGACGPSRRRFAMPVTLNAPIRRRRPAPSSSATALSNSNVRPRKPPPPAAPRMPRQPGPARRNGESGPIPRWRP